MSNVDRRQWKKSQEGFEGHLEEDFKLKQIGTLGRRSKKLASHHPKYHEPL